MIDLRELPAARIRLFDFSSAPMRAFHVTWLSFFCCFVAWFAVAPLMAIVRAEMHLTPRQVSHLMTASVAMTVLARLVVGWICDRVGPRRTYVGLLLVAALPLLAMPLARGYVSFCILRLLSGIAGASFVITQVHTSLMFARNCVGTANATAAGWGNLGGGAAQLLLPLLTAAFVALGVGDYWAWRLATVVPGLLLIGCAFAYARLTQDLPNGDYAELRRRGALPPPKPRAFLVAARDARVWLLGLCYGACFGVEIALDNAAALYFRDRFALGLGAAGAVAALFGGMNLFARALGGIVGDRVGARFGLRGRLRTLGVILLAEGAALVVFAHAGALGLAVPSFMLVGLLVAMGAGATYSVVPFLQPRAMGSVSGIVGAGGNLGAVAASMMIGAGGGHFMILAIAVALLAPLAELASMLRREPARAQFSAEEAESSALAR